jgi:transposase-like protein
MKKSVKFSPEVRERAVRLVTECRKDHPSQWAVIGSIAVEIGCSANKKRGLAMQYVNAK